MCQPLNANKNLVKKGKKSDIIEKVTPNEANQILDPLFTVNIDPFFQNGLVTLI